MTCISPERPPEPQPKYGSLITPVLFSLCELSASGTNGDSPLSSYSHNYRWEKPHVQSGYTHVKNGYIWDVKRPGESPLIWETFLFLIFFSRLEPFFFTTAGSPPLLMLLHALAAQFICFMLFEQVAVSTYHQW